LVNPYEIRHGGKGGFDEIRCEKKRNIGWIKTEKTDIFIDIL